MRCSCLAPFSCSKARRAFLGSPRPKQLVAYSQRLQISFGLPRFARGRMIPVRSGAEEERDLNEVEGAVAPDQ